MAQVTPQMPTPTRFFVFVFRTTTFRTAHRFLGTEYLEFSVGIVFARVCFSSVFADTTAWSSGRDRFFSDNTVFFSFIR